MARRDIEPKNLGGKFVLLRSFTGSHNRRDDRIGARRLGADIAKRTAMAQTRWRHVCSHHDPNGCQRSGPRDNETANHIRPNRWIDRVSRGHRLGERSAKR